MSAPHPDWIVPEWPTPPRVRTLITTRAGGASHGPYASFNLSAHVGDAPMDVERNRERLRSVLPADPVWLEQVHGAEVVAAEAAQPLQRADGAVAHVRHVVCAVMTADCLPVLLARADGQGVGIAHAGWRGLAAGVVENTLWALGGDPAHTLAYLGPAIGPRHFEVGTDVYDAFVGTDAEARQAFASGAPGKFFADLYELARRRLRRAGVTQIYGGGACTYGEIARFFSYRRERTTGRMASLIWLD